MKKLVILGAGCAGTMVANKLRKKLAQKEWSITIIDKDDKHIYQPGLLFIPFGIYQAEDVVRSRSEFIARGLLLSSMKLLPLTPTSRLWRGLPVITTMIK